MELLQFLPTSILKWRGVQDGFFKYVMLGMIPSVGQDILALIRMVGLATLSSTLSRMVCSLSSGASSYSSTQKYPAYLARYLLSHHPGDHEAYLNLTLKPLFLFNT